MAYRTLEADRFTSVDGISRAVGVIRRRVDALAPRANCEVAATITLNPSKVAVAPARPTKRDITDLDRLDGLQYQAKLIGNIVGQLQTSFVGVPAAKAVIKAAQTLAKDIEDRSNKLHRKLAESARKRVSRSLVMANHRVAQILHEDFRGRFARIDESYLLSKVRSPEGADVNAEVAYVRVTDLKGDDGSVHPFMYIFLARPERDAKDKFWVATTTEYRVPGKVAWERSAKTNEVKQIVLSLLAEDSVVGKAFPRDIPIPSDQVTFVHDNVKSVTAANGVIRVTVKNRKQLTATRNALRKQLTSIVARVDPRNRDVIRDSIETDKGAIKFVFSLSKSQRKRVLGKDVVARLGNMLNVSPEVLQRVKSVIEEG